MLEMFEHEVLTICRYSKFGVTPDSFSGDGRACAARIETAADMARVVKANFMLMSPGCAFP